MGFFKELKAMADITKDIISTGKKTAAACEKMDSLIAEARTKKGLLAGCTNAIKAYDDAKSAYEHKPEGLSNEESNALNDKLEETQVKCMEAFAKSPVFSADFQNQCKSAVKEYKDANNAMMDSLGEKVASFAETDEERKQVMDAIKEEKK